MHRLRDLDRCGRVVAGLFVAALLLAPVVAFARALPEWMPSSDPAVMALRTLDVGTDRTPLTGQPSTSAVYIGGDRHVDHPGPLHFYLMAGPVRLLGSAVGMLSVSLAIVGTCLVVSAWAVFRQLGSRAAIIASLTLAAITFTTGAASLINPVSSNIAGYPLLCSVVLLWCLACGDHRLLPLTAVIVSFTLQQHLSVVAATTIVTIAGLALLGMARRRSASPGRTRPWVAATAGIGLVLWAPVLYQQVTGSPGNLTMMVRFATDEGRTTLGPRVGARPLVHTLGLPPLLGRTDLNGADLVAPVSAVTVATAAVVAIALVALEVAWRRTHPRRAALVAMAGATAVAGVVNGMSIPVGIESFRLVFYHWVFPLALLATIVLGLALTDAIERVKVTRRQVIHRGAIAVGLAAMAAVALVNPTLDRYSNTAGAAYSAIDRSVMDELADEIVADRGQIAERPVVLSRGYSGFSGFGGILALALTERGLTATLPEFQRHYVHDDHLVDADTVEGGLVLVVEGASEPVGDDVGTLVAEVDLIADFDRIAFEELVEQAAAGPKVELGPGQESMFDALPPAVIADVLAGGSTDLGDYDQVMRKLGQDGTEQLVLADRLAALVDAPRPALLSPRLLRLIQQHPLSAPELDPQLIARVLDSIPPDHEPSQPFGLSVYRVDRDQLLAIATSNEL